MNSNIESYPERVKRIIRFCEMLIVPDGALAGTRVVLRPWQKDIISSVYGPCNSEGLRIVREALLTMGRKNGKTATIAMLLLVHLCGPEAIRNGQLYSVAFDREQAALVFKYAASMVYASEHLSLRLNIVETQKKIVDPVSGSTYIALSAESRTKHGRSSSVIIFDELAQFGRDRRLYDVMMTSRGAHVEPLVWTISTQADNDAALFSELVDRGRKIMSGEISDPTSLAFIYEVPPDKDAFDEAHWHMANPALGDFLNIEIMREDARKAQSLPGFENAFRNLNLNQRVSADECAIAPEIWINNSDAPDESLFESGIPCYAGLDLSAKNDLTAMVFSCMDDDRKWHILPYFWSPKEKIRERSQRDRVPYDEWAKRGYLTATPGAVVNYEDVAKFLGDCHAKFNIQALRFDRWRVDFFIEELRRAGVPCWIDGKDEPVPGGLRLISHGQGFKDLSPAVDRVEDLLFERRLRHGKHPILTMCAANARYSRDPSGNRKYDKMKSTGRIDGLVAMAMALNWTQEIDRDSQGSLEDLYASDPIVINW